VDIIKKYSLAFLRRWLLNDQTADAVLDVRDPLFLLYEKQVPQTETGNPKPEVQNPRRSRMIIDQLKNASLYRQMSPKLAVAFDFLQKTDFSRLAPGRYEIDGPSVYATVLQYETKPMDQCSWEAHRKYIDVQYIVEGTERMGHANVQDLTPSQPYDEAQDFLKLQGTGNFFVVGPGTFLVFTPQDAHMPGIAVTNPQPVRKVVVKVLAP
jgi:YhcH/YjgK/YiaL family protein